MSSAISGQTLSQKAADAIVHLIQSENYTAGTKLPNEYDLSRMLKVSRNTVREAIKLLVSRNILEVRRGAGTFVSDKHGLGDDPLGLSMVTDPSRILEEILQLCLLIEPRIAALAAQHMTAEEFQKLSLLLSELEALQPEGNQGHKIAQFHIQLARSSQNTVICNINTAIYNYLVQQNLFTAFDSSCLLNDCRSICQAIKEHNVCRAYDAMLAHLLHQQEQMQSKLS